jgi:acyl dehydratase
MVVHGEQRFEYQRPLRAGDVVVTESTVAGMRSIGRNERLEIQTVITTVEGEHVCTAHNVLIERGA